MGRHSARGGEPLGTRQPQEISSIAPMSSYTETQGQAKRRLRETNARPVNPRRRAVVIRRTLITVALVVLFGVAGTAAAAALWMGYINGKIIGQPLPKVIGSNKLPASPLVKPPPPGDPFYMLIFGVDTRPNEVGVARSDTLILVRVDPKQKHIAMISIPRDTRVPIPGHKTFKINSAMQWGGPSLAIQTVHELTGLPISHYMTVNFNSFKDLVDAIGGVDINVPERIVDLEAAGWDRKAMVVPAGFQKLDGKHALTFVRARHQFADQDYTRMRDQQEFIKALAKQTLQLKNVWKVQAIVSALVNNVKTDMPIEQILGIVGQFNGMKPNGVETVTLPSDPKMIGKVAYVIVDTSKMDAMLERFAAGQPLKPGDTTSSDQTATTSTVASGSAQPINATATVRNGMGKKGVAAQAASELTQAGFTVKEVGNTAKPVYDQTLIIYKADRTSAELVEQTLGFGKIVASRGLYSFTTDVMLVVGKDWTPSVSPSNPVQTTQ